MTPDQARARMKARKAGATTGQMAGVGVVKAKADTRARLMIERAQRGETHEAIAQALGLARCTVSQAISRYRRRHLISINHDAPHTGFAA